MMKILAVDCRMARMSGIGVYLRKLLPLCMDAMPETEFRLLAYDGSFALPAGGKWRAVPFDAPVYGLAEQYRALPLLRDCDALWSPHYPVPLLAASAVVATVHDVAHLALRDLYSGAYRLYARLMFQALRRKAAEILFVSGFTRDEFLHYVGKPGGHMSVVHNGVDASWLQLPLLDRYEPPYFLAVGNVKPHKNVQLLCRAFARVADRCAARLLFVGENSSFRIGEASLEELRHICPGRIDFTGFISRERLAALLGRATALIFPSRYEGFGLPLLEALGGGIPVIASDIGVSREVCGDFALYFPSESEERLADLLLEALAMPPLERRERGERGRIWASRFTWAKAAAATVPVLRRALEKSKTLGRC